MKKIVILAVIIAAVAFYLNRENGQQVADKVEVEQDQDGVFSHLPQTVDNARDAASIANQAQQRMQEAQDQSN